MADSKDPLQDIHDQFKDMHQSLDQIAKNTEPVAEVAKKEISHSHRPNAPVMKVDLGKETKRDILTALKNIRNQIVVTQHRESTMADVAAEALASGKGLAGAAEAALSFKKEKLKASFKRKFDPLNIVSRFTGGSKLATVLAGKVMGRSEQSIRGAAGLQQLAPSPTPFMGDQGMGPSPMASDQASGLLGQMAGTLSEILEHLKRSEFRAQASEQRTTDLLQDQTDHIAKMSDETEDAAALAKSGAKKGTATQVTKGATKEEEKKGGGLLDMLMKMLFSPLGLAITGLVAAGALLFSQWDNLKLAFSAIGESIQELWQSIKDGLSSIGTWVTESLTAAYDSVIEAGESLVEGLKDTFGFGSSAEEKQADIEKRAAAGEGFAQRKLARQAAELVVPTAALQSTVEKISTPPTLKAIPQEKLAGEAEKLRKGDYTQDAIGALTQGKPIAGSPEKVAVGGALTHMVAKTYREHYKVSPLNDDPKMREQRLPAVVQAAATQLADRIATPGAISQTSTPTSSQITSTATEVPAPAALTGQTLSQANDLQRTAAMAPMAQGGTGGNTIINNVKNNNTNSSTVHQNMSPARSEESSYLRSLDRGYAPA